MSKKKRDVLPWVNSLTTPVTSTNLPLYLRLAAAVSVSNSFQTSIASSRFSRLCQIRRPPRTRSGRGAGGIQPEILFLRCFLGGGLEGNRSCTGRCDGLVGLDLGLQPRRWLLRISFGRDEVRLGRNVRLGCLTGLVDPR